jgi:tetratricopeptide (TPR) repeat protein
MAMTNIAATLKDEKRWSESKAMYEEAAPIERKVLGDQHFLTISTRAAIAEILIGEGDYSGAEKGFRDVIEVDRKALGETHPSAISHTDELGIALAHQHKDKEATKVLNDALHLAEKSKQNKVIADAWYNLAAGAAIEGHREEPLEMLKKAFEHGYVDVEAARADDDLESLRGDSRFEAILAGASKL